MMKSISLLLARTYQKEEKEGEKSPKKKFT
jgi:hypothetical protein